MGRTSIEWTARSWNPIRGTKGRHICERISQGCKNCYAATMNRRFSGIDYVADADVPRLDETALGEPLRWRLADRCFVCSMTDLFWDKVPDEWIGRIFAVMGTAKEHVYQILTKRPERMLAFITKYAAPGGPLGPWPWPQIHLGVSVEDQTTADARIPLLLQTPAAVRWVSYEPALGPADFLRWLRSSLGKEYRMPGLDWLVVGGESGPGARPFDLAWARQTIAQGREAGVPVFVKQLGAHPTERELYPDGAYTGKRALYDLKDRKGGDPQEWPEDLRVREYPQK